MARTWDSTDKRTNDFVFRSTAQQKVNRRKGVAVVLSEKAVMA